MNARQRHEELMARSAKLFLETRARTQETNDKAAEITRWLANFVQDVYKDELKKGNHPRGWKNHLRVVR